MKLHSTLKNVFEPNLSEAYFLEKELFTDLNQNLGSKWASLKYSNPNGL